MSRGQRGHALLLLMAALTAFVVGISLFESARTERVERRVDEGVRTQALWLARSALDAGVVGQRTVETPHGTATVRATAGEVRVELRGAEASLKGGVERFSPATD